MSSICPVCNGLQDLQTNCPICSKRMCDHGKPSDLLGPYSPYEIPDNTLLNGDGGDQQQPCLHLVICPDCQISFTLHIPTKQH